jgi:hypothetical protein
VVHLRRLLLRIDGLLRLLGTRRCAWVDRMHYGLLGLGRPALGLAGPLFGLGDTVAQLLEPLLAIFLLGFQRRQPLRFGGTLFRRFRALFDLRQPPLRL